MNIEMFNRPRARKSDPDTSKEAAKRAERFAGSHAWKILTALHEGWGTAETISRATGLTVEQICRRLPEIADIEPATADGVPCTLHGFRLWRVRPEPCHFTTAGEADREAIK